MDGTDQDGDIVGIEEVDAAGGDDGRAVDDATDQEADGIPEGVAS